jgi:hypothetical protein
MRLPGHPAVPASLLFVHNKAGSLAFDFASTAKSWIRGSNGRARNRNSLLFVYNVSVWERSWRPTAPLEVTVFFGLVSFRQIPIGWLLAQ